MHGFEMSINGEDVKFSDSDGAKKIYEQLAALEVDGGPNDILLAAKLVPLLFHQGVDPCYELLEGFVDSITLFSSKMRDDDRSCYSF